MAETLSTLSIISLIVAAVCFVFAVFLWFFFGIPSVMGDLNGRNAKKSISKMRAINEKSGLKVHKGSKTNASRGRLTEPPNTDKPKDKPETGLLFENEAEDLDSEATGMLVDDSTDVLVDVNGTISLLEDAPVQNKNTSKIKLEIIEEVMLIHTEEVI